MFHQGAEVDAESSGKSKRYRHQGSLVTRAGAPSVASIATRNVLTRPKARSSIERRAGEEQCHKWGSGGLAGESRGSLDAS